MVESKLLQLLTTEKNVDEGDFCHKICKACGIYAKLKYNGKQEDGKGGFFPLYTCKECGSTRVYFS